MLYSARKDIQTGAAAQRGDRKGEYVNASIGRGGESLTTAYSDEESFSVGVLRSPSQRVEPRLTA